MRTTLLSARLASLVALAGASACGGNVVVDGSPGGDDGSGGAGAGATSSVNASSGPQTASSSGAGSADSVRASCDLFCDLFDDTACREPGCRQACADLLSEPRPCIDLIAPFFSCMGGIVDVPSVTTCEEISAWLDPLFACVVSREPECDVAFVYADCKPYFEEHRACQRGGGR